MLLTPSPEVRIVPNDHELLAGGAVARAVLFDSGRDMILISVEAAEHPAIANIIDHELSHIAAWREHGPGIKEHGREWLNICRQRAANPRACKVFIDDME